MLPIRIARLNPQTSDSVSRSCGVAAVVGALEGVGVGVIFDLGVGVFVTSGGGVAVRISSSWSMSKLPLPSSGEKLNP